MSTTNTIKISYRNSPAFDVVACLHAIAKNKDKKITNKRLNSIVSVISKELYDDIIAYSKITYDWLLILDMVTSLDAKENIPRSIDSILEDISSLSDLEFCKFLIGEHKFDDAMLQSLLDIPELSLDMSQFYPSYVDKRELYNFIYSRDKIRAQIINTINVFWKKVYRSIWHTNRVGADFALSSLSYKVDGNTNILLKSLNKNLSCVYGQIIYSNINEYPVFNFPFHRAIKKINVYSSMFLFPHNYMNTFSEQLNLSYALSYENQSEDNFVDRELVNELKSVSDKVRLSILIDTRDNPMTTSQMTARYSLTIGNISKHIKILRNANLLHRKRIKHEVFYFSDKEKLSNIISRLIDVTNYSGLMKK
ncbi:ArsR/SmtB family transcription factor [Vibrio artabrorum]|nr:winged helix-turn-helix domain-containing protein [Vibrio artabrorum]